MPWQSCGVSTDPYQAGARPPILRNLPLWLALGMLMLAARLPGWLRRALGVCLGWMMLHLMSARRRVARRNLQLCFPDLDSDQRQRMLRSSFRSLGLGAMEFAQAWWGDVETQRSHSTLKGLEHLLAAQAEGRGVLLVSGHFMTLEICGRLLCEHAPVAGMYRPHGTAVFEWAVRRGRLRYASAMFTHDQLRPAIRHLRGGGVLWYAPDHAYRRGEHVFAPFFGHSVATLSSTHQLAKMTNAVVIAFHHRRRADGLGYEMRLEPALQDFPSDDPLLDSARINAMIEAMIREAPDEYLWLHKRFKMLPPGTNSAY